MLEENRILYLHGRPMAHPIHEALAKSLGCDFYPSDKYMRWQDRNKNILYRITSSFINALLYPTSKYNAILVDNLHFAPIIARKLGIVPKSKKIIVHLGSHTLYFMFSNKFSPIVKKMHLWALSNYDILLCEGQMAQNFCIEMLGEKMPLSYVTFLGPKMERCNYLNQIEPNLNTKNIVTICHGPGEFRKWYKGMDIMIEAVGKAIKKDKMIKFYIYGVWDKFIKEEMLSKVDEEYRDNIIFAGSTDNIVDALTNSSLYLHISRGDAFPTSTIEAAHAGLPVMISNYTGTKEIFYKINNNFITEINVDDVSEKINWYFKLPFNEKLIISNKIRNLVQNYTEENAIKHYKNIFSKI